jgi:hypothetical protein
VVRKYLKLGLPDLFYSTPVLHWFKLEMMGNDVQDSRTVCLRNNPLKASYLVVFSLWRMNNPVERKRF